MKSTIKAFSVSTRYEIDCSHKYYVERDRRSLMASEQFELCRRKQLENFWETGWSAYGLSETRRYALEPNWIELTASRVGLRWSWVRFHLVTATLEIPLNLVSKGDPVFAAVICSWWFLLLCSVPSYILYGNRVLDYVQVYKIIVLSPFWHSESAIEGVCLWRV